MSTQILAIETVSHIGATSRGRQFVRDLSQLTVQQVASL
jgi:hypothetical protein